MPLRLAGKVGWVCVLAVCAQAQTCVTSSAPSSVRDLEREVNGAPTARNHALLGLAYLQAGMRGCGIAALKESLRLDGSKWDLREFLANAYLEGGEPARAADELRRVIAAAPRNENARTSLGLALFRLGDLPGAEESTRAALEVDPASPAAANQLARIYLRQNRRSAAIACLKVALRQPLPAAPADSLRRTLSEALGANGDFAEAISVLKEIVDAGRGSLVDRLNLALAYGHDRQFGPALAEFDEALRLDPGNRVALVNSAKMLISLGNPSEAVRRAQQYVSREAADWEGHYITGLAYLGVPDLPAAERALRRALELNPAQFDIHHRLGLALLRMQRLPEARQQLGEARRLKPDSAEVRYALAQVEQAQGNPEAAKAEFIELQRLKQQEVEGDVAALRANEGNRLLQSRDLQAAVDAYREAVRSYPRSAKAHYNLALALGRLGDAKAQRRELEAALQLDENLASVHTALGILEVSAGHPHEGEMRFQKAIALDPQNAEAKNNLGVLYTRRGDMQRGIPLLRAATEDNPQYGMAYLNYGVSLAAAGRLQEARVTLNRCETLMPDRPEAFQAMGMVESQLGLLAAAISTFSRAAELQPESPQSHANLAKALADGFDPERAAAEYGKAARLAPDSGEMHYLYGRALHDLRRDDAACDELRCALRLSPEHPAASQLLRRLKSSPGTAVLERGSGPVTNQIGNLLAQANVAEEARDWPAAEAALRTAIAVCGACDSAAQLHRGLGFLLGRKGDLPAAVEELRTGLKLNPQDEAASSALTLIAARQRKP